MVFLFHRIAMIGVIEVHGFNMVTHEIYSL